MTSAATSHPILAGISRTHGDIIAHLFHLCGLGTQAPLDEDARSLALHAMQFFQRTVVAHHQAEELRLFPLVLDHAQPGAERDYVETMVAKLTGEHRCIEALWARVDGMLTALLAGQGNSAIDAHIQELALHYGDHATDEEARFLPLCQVILLRSRVPATAADLLHVAPSQQP